MRWFSKQWFHEKWKTRVTLPLAAPLIAAAIIASLTVFEVARPALATAGAPTPAPAAAPLDVNSISALLSLDQAMETLAARVTPAVVNVAVTSKVKASQAELPDDMRPFFGPDSGPNFGPNFRRFARPQPQVEHGIGSGVIISPDGYIVTNNHVVEGAEEIRVTMHDKRILKATLVGADPLTDLAVIKIDGTNLPSVPWGDSKELRPGQTVLAFGNPFGFRFTVTRGIVSALNRPNPYSDDARKPGEFIQTDAAINQGNSGGPLVDARGEVVGINTFLISPSGAFSGMGFAIPAQIAEPTVKTLIQYGKVSHGYMGIGITDVTPENAKFFDATHTTGAVITQVEPDSPAARAGLKVGDVITGVDQKSVSGAGELQAEVGLKKPGTSLKLDVMRDGKSMTIPVTLGAMGANGQENETADEGKGKPRWGLAMEDLTPDVRQQLQAPGNIKGAVIDQVRPGSAADDAGLQAGDVIVGVNRKPVTNASEAKQALASVPRGQDVLVLVWSNGGSTFRVLHAPEGA
ncbi:MAG TPA: Do family serine endopeptidase [Terriglobales bacterium]|nr:Do family serine endopeptidase [Terriglobales bacterium]